ncbi:hypothetical protein BG011_007888 [Mortierella polycephala]|uniref:Uncharacterized protein n=1 Tax=Mortierella polycephala TaxID=41804 RepID=A0A9P6PP35_9FUNG|nr:hypothetical protein BG011_007888 [Mortierella polycephala]
MALARNHRILQGITHGLFKNTSVLLNNQSTFTRLCNFPVITVVPKRCYIPSLTLSQLQQTTGDTTQTPYQAQHGNSEKMKTKKTRNNAPKVYKGDKDQYIVTSWTTEEDSLLAGYVKKGADLRDIIEFFPNRTVSSIDSRMNKIWHQLKTDLPPTQLKARKSPFPRAWTKEEDERLRILMSRIPQGSPTALNWSAISNAFMDGKRLARTTTSCKRRWSIIKPDSCLMHGSWELDESRKLVKEILEQIESPDGADTSTDSFPNLEDRIRQLSLKDMHKVDWQAAAINVGSRSDSQCRSHVYNNLRSVKKGSWSSEEVAQLHQGLKEHGYDWNKIGEAIPTRSPFQIKRKFYKTIRPRIKELSLCF